MDALNLPVAEHSLLGSMMRDASLIPEVLSIVCEADFTSPLARKVYRTIVELHGSGKAVDAVTVSDALDDFSPVKIHHATVTAANGLAYAERVRERSQRRQLGALLVQTQRVLEGTAPTLEVLAELQSKADGIVRRQTGVALGFSEVLRAGLASIESANAASAAGGCAGVPTGLMEIDQRTGGLQDGRLVVLAARPSAGKTALANQTALHAATRGYGVGLASLEMSAAEIATRSLAHRYQLNGSALAFGSDAEIKSMVERMTADPMPNLPIWVDADTFSLPGIVARIAEWKRQQDIRLAVVDHIGLVEVEGSTSANDRLGRISRELKKAAKRLQIPIVAVSQLNREVEKQKRRPVLADLRDSGSIEQDADIAIFLHSEPDEGGAGPTRMEIGLLKNRAGRKGWINRPFWFDGRTQTFTESGR